MNLLQILTQACQQIGIPAPSTLIGLTDNNNLQVLALFYDVHGWLRNQRCWVQSKRTHIFDLEANKQSYQLPQDYYAGILGTQYDDTTKFPLVGPLSDAQFDRRQYGLIGFNPFPAYRIFGPDANPYSAGGQFEVWPEPTAAGDTLSFEYQTKSIFLPPNWTPSTAYAVNDYVNANGNNYRCTTLGTSSATTAPTGKSTTPQINGTAQFAYVPQSYDTILSDEDLSMYDDDLIMSGFKAWYYDAKGQPQAASSMQQFKEQVDSAKARYYGSYRGTLSRRKKGWFRGISPEGGWSL